MCSRHFDTQKSAADAKEASKLFSVPDFVGDACKAIASRVRGAVAQCKFDDFHKASGVHACGWGRIRVMGVLMGACVCTFCVCVFMIIYVFASHQLSG